MTHTGALAGSDAVYDAAFRRAGLLRVIGLDELFAAAETLGQVKPFAGKRLAILTNGGGIGVLAVDRLADLGGMLAEISPATMQRLDAALPPIWSHANPVDIAGDADGARYAAAFEALLDDPEQRRRAGDERADRARVRDRRRAGRGRGRAQASRQDGRAQAGIRGLGRRQQRGRGELRACRHSRLCDRIGSGRRLYASGALPRGAGRPDGDAAEPAGGFFTRLAGGARRDRRQRWRPAPSGSIRSRPRACLPPTPFRSRPPCWRATPTRPRPWPPHCCRADRPWWPRSCRPTSCTNRRSAACA